MIPILSIFAIIGVFVAGYAFVAHTMAGCILLGLCVIGLGTMIAAMQLHPHEGQRTPHYLGTLTWSDVYHYVTKFAVQRNIIAGVEPVYVQTPKGPVPVTSVFTARINHVLSIVMDTEDVSAVDASHEFNAVKQGVM